MGRCGETGTGLRAQRRRLLHAAIAHERERRDRHLAGGNARMVARIERMIARAEAAPPAPAVAGRVS